MKMAPDYCTVYVISKGKVASCRSPPIPNQREREHSLHSSLNGGRGMFSQPSFLHVLVLLNRCVVVHIICSQAINGGIRFNQVGQVTC